MSLTQTYMLAHLSRKQLSKEAARADHNLRRLVGHANMLDNLMLDLANAEQEQESWFNQTVKNAHKASEEPKHIQWVDTVPEEVVEEFDDSDSESESDDGQDEDFETALEVPLRTVAPASPTLELDDEDEEMEDDDEFGNDLALTRTSSAHPPELMHEDSDSESDDESMPPSPPPQTEVSFDTLSNKQREAIATSSFYQSQKSIPHSEEEASIYDQGFYLPQRQTAIAAY